MVIPWLEIGQGYSYLTEAQAHSLVRGARLVFSFHERTYGDLALYQKIVQQKSALLRENSK